MAGKKNAQQITIDDIMKLGPKKIILLIIAAVAVYFFGNDTFLQEHDDSGIIPGIVARVVDGDTAVITVDGQERRVRFLGVDTPETVHPNKPVQYYGKEASSFTKNSLTGRRVWLEYDSSPTDRYNRHLAYIWLNKPATIDEQTIRRDMFNARLLLDGYARTMIIKPNTRYAKLFGAFQDEAKSSRKGLWAE